MITSCLECNHFFECTKPQRKKNQSCSEWSDVILSPNMSSINIVMGSELSINLDNTTEEEMEKHKLDLYGTIDKILKSPSAVLPDLEYDDSDMKRFRNFHHACLSTKGLNFALYARQMLIGIHVLGEWCPICTKKKYRHITGIPVDYNVRDLEDKVTLLHNGRCPKCKRSKRKLLKKGVLQPYGSLAACIGQRAGKSFTMYYISCYITMQYLLLQDPIHALKLGTGSMLTGTFTGLSFDRAVKLLWLPIRNILTKSPWFKEYNEIMSHYDEKYGENNLKLGDLMITYGHRSMMLYPIGPNKRMLRGDSRFQALVDEIGWYPLENPHLKENRERANATEVVDALDSSLLTVRNAVEKMWKKGHYDVPMAMLLATSSPQDARDKIMSLVREAKGSRTGLGIQLATWEVNPEYSKNSTYIRERFRLHPVNAERDFGANPPRNSNPYMKNLYECRNSFDTTKKNGIKIRPTYTSRDEGLDYKSAELVRVTPASYPTILSLDAGMVKDSFAITALGYNSKGRLGIRGMVEILPNPRQNIIHMPSLMRNVVEPIITKMNVCLVVSDRWQQYKMLQDLEETMSVAIMEYSVKYEDMENFKHSISNNEEPYIIPCKGEIPSLGDNRELRKKYKGKKISLDSIDAKFVEEYDALGNYPQVFEGKPMLHLAYQLLYVRDDGKTILKGAGVTDDILRSAILGHTIATDTDIIEKYNLMSPVGFVAGKGSSSVIGVRSGSGGKIVSSGAGRIGAKGNFGGK